MNELPEYGPFSYEGDCCFIDGTFRAKEHVSNIFYVLEMETQDKEMKEMGYRIGEPVSWCCICGGLGFEDRRCWGCQ